MYINVPETQVVVPIYVTFQVYVWMQVYVPEV